MRLDLGGLETIENPTPEHVTHHLRYMRAESAFVILEESTTRFIQAAATSEGYRVEYRFEADQFYILTEYEEAVELFLAFLNSEALDEMVVWKKMTVLNTPNHPLVLWLIILIMLFGVVWAVVNEITKW